MSWGYKREDDWVCVVLFVAVTMLVRSAIEVEVEVA